MRLYWCRDCVAVTCGPGCIASVWLLDWNIAVIAVMTAAAASISLFLDSIISVASVASVASAVSVFQFTWITEEKNRWFWVCSLLKICALLILCDVFLFIFRAPFLYTELSRMSVFVFMTEFKIISFGQYRCTGAKGYWGINVSTVWHPDIINRFIQCLHCAPSPWLLSASRIAGYVAYDIRLVCEDMERDVDLVPWCF